MTTYGTPDAPTRIQTTHRSVLPRSGHTGAGSTLGVASSNARSPERARGLRSLAAFAILAYGWSWGLMGAAALLLRSGAVSEATAGLLGGIAGYGPSIAGLAVAATLGRQALRELLAALVR